MLLTWWTSKASGPMASLLILHFHAGNDLLTPFFACHPSNGSLDLTKWHTMTFVQKRSHLLVLDFSLDSVRNSVSNEADPPELMTVSNQTSNDSANRFDYARSTRLLPTPETNWGWLHLRALYSLTMGTSWNSTWRHGTLHPELFHQTGTALPTRLSMPPPSIQPLPTPIQSPLRLKGEQRDHCMSNRQEPWSSRHGPCRLHQTSTQRPSQIKHLHLSEPSRSPQSNVRHWTQINKATRVIWWYTI